MKSFSCEALLVFRRIARCCSRVRPWTQVLPTVGKLRHSSGVCWCATTIWELLAGQTASNAQLESAKIKEDCIKQGLYWCENDKCIWINEGQVVKWRHFSFSTIVSCGDKKKVAQCLRFLDCGMCCFSVECSKLSLKWSESTIEKLDCFKEKWQKILVNVNTAGKPVHWKLSIQTGSSTFVFNNKLRIQTETTAPKYMPTYLNIIGKTDMLYLYKSHGTMFAWFCFWFTRVDGSYDSCDGWQDTSMVCFRTCHSTKFQSGLFNWKPLTNNFALCQEHNPHFSLGRPCWQRPRKRAGISGNSTLKLRDNAKVWRSAHAAGKTESVP